MEQITLCFYFVKAVRENFRKCRKFAVFSLTKKRLELLLGYRGIEASFFWKERFYALKNNPIG
jgi:hypothetical protein